MVAYIFVPYINIFVALYLKSYIFVALCLISYTSCAYYAKVCVCAVLHPCIKNKSWKRERKRRQICFSKTLQMCKYCLWVHFKAPQFKSSLRVLFWNCFINQQLSEIYLLNLKPVWQLNDFPIYWRISFQTVLSTNSIYFKLTLNKSTPLWKFVNFQPLSNIDTNDLKGLLIYHHFAAGQHLTKHKTAF